jgi:hypothetical protein
VNIIKENMFFVVMGVVVLLALVLFLVLVQPIKSENAAREKDVQSLLSSLNRLRDKPEMPNDVAIHSAQEYRKRYDDQLQALIDELSKMQLSTDLPTLPPEEKDQPGAFKTVYQKDVELLKRRLDEKRITTGTREVWYFWDWGDGVPKQAEQRELATKEYSLMHELIEIIASPELSVMQLDCLEVTPGEVRTGDYSLGRGGATTRSRVEPYFDVYPFILEIRMPFQKYELLLRDLLTSRREIPIYIRTVSMMRLEDDPRVYKHMPTTLYIGIRVTGWALDYRPEDRRAVTTGGTGGGPVPGVPAGLPAEPTK